MPCYSDVFDNVIENEKRPPHSYTWALSHDPQMLSDYMNPLLLIQYDIFTHSFSSFVIIFI